MKLQDLATPQQSKQTAKVFESYFGQSIDFGRLSGSQARSMLHKVKGLINEHRRQPGFHNSEQNPAYLKLVVMEQGLTARMRESQLDEVASQSAQDTGRAVGEILGAGIGFALGALPGAVIGGLALGPGGAIGGGLGTGLPAAMAGTTAGGMLGRRATNFTHDALVNMWRKASAKLGGPEATAEFIRAHAQAADMGQPSFRFGERKYAVTMDRAQARKAMNDLAKMQQGMSESQPPGASPGQAQPGQNQPTQDPNATAAGVRRIASATGQSSQAAVLGKAIDAAVAGQALNPTQRSAMATQMGGIQKALADPVMAQRLQQTLKTATATENRKIRGRRLREASEVQQAQVVLAAQDMVDKMQKMLEEVSAMQFKDLPALVDSIKNEVGQQQANQFNADATAALSGLMQNLQASKQQMDAALGVVTGQAAAPVADMGAAPELGAVGDELGAMGSELDAAAADAGDEVEQPAGTAPDLGRGRR